MDEKEITQERFEKVLRSVLVAGVAAGVHSTMTALFRVNGGKLALLSENEWQDVIDSTVEAVEDKLTEGTEIGLLERMLRATDEKEGQS